MYNVNRQETESSFHAKGLVIMFYPTVRLYHCWVA